MSVCRHPACASDRSRPHERAITRRLRVHSPSLTAQTWFMRSLAILVACFVGCRASGEVAEAIIATSVALTASAVSRSQGGCFSMCLPGTVCNEAIGTCEVLPCRGECASGESCERTSSGDRCVAAARPAVIPVDAPCEGAGCGLAPWLVIPGALPMPHPQLEEESAPK